MELSRRTLLAGGFAAVLGGTVVACSSGMDNTSTTKKNTATELTLWCWPGGLGKSVIDDTVAHFPDPKIKYSEIGGDFKQKLITTFNGGTGIPDITGIKGEDIASMLPQANRFVDLKTLGADSILGDYVEWKVKQATTLDGKVLGLPIDIGPTGLFYREDIFAKGGLPSDPAKVADQLKTWDDFFAAGVELKKANPKALIVWDATDLYDIVVGQGTERYISKDNTFIGDQDHIKKAWDTVVKAMTLKIDGKTPSGGPDWNAGLDQGTVPAHIGAAWAALDITKNAADPAKAFEVIKYMLSPDNQAKAYADAQIFPATPAAYDKPQLKGADPFFGGQVPIDVFGPAAKAIPVAYQAPSDDAVGAPYKDELKTVQSGAKSSDAAWAAAVSKAKAIAKRQGVQ